MKECGIAQLMFSHVRAVGEKFFCRPRALQRHHSLPNRNSEDVLCRLRVRSMETLDEVPFPSAVALGGCAAPQASWPRICSLTRVL